MTSFFTCVTGRQFLKLLRASKMYLQSDHFSSPPWPPAWLKSPSSFTFTTEISFIRGFPPSALGLFFFSQQDHWEQFVKMNVRPYHSCWNTLSRFLRDLAFINRPASSSPSPSFFPSTPPSRPLMTPGICHTLLYQTVHWHFLFPPSAKWPPPPL